MIVIPAIDLRAGKCVRLFQGDYAKETVYGEDPVAMALRWQKEGGEWLHLVDLDGAKAGRPVQLDTVRRICERVAIPVELGGGLRTLEDARSALGAGVERLILGTVALESPDLLSEVCRELPGRVYVALDARDGKVATRGWTESSGVDVLEAALECERRGAAGFLFTDISRDGTGEGVNAEATAALAGRVSVPVVASGGVGGVEDIRRLRARGAAGIAAVIVGRALYTGKVRLPEAIAAAREG
ncbi:MAG: 1-(5-phosphoribosyl)-5-[(5-phosphoribosylamino)methylideneamino]imidazole-4-carboxamide isomerase [Candidatus Binatia bacterium]